MGSDAMKHYTSYTDNRGKVRYKFARYGFPGWSLHGEPGTEEFARSLAEAIAGRRPTKARPNNGLVPRSIRAAWSHHMTTPAHRGLKRSSAIPLERIASQFMASLHPSGTPYGDMPIKEMRRADVKAILGLDLPPSRRRQILRILRSCCSAALDLEWTDKDPTLGIKAVPVHGPGRRAWTDKELTAFERAYDYDETPRLIYALALYTGQRRGDIAAMRWADIAGGRIRVASQEKTSASVDIPVHAELRAILERTPRRSPWIVTNDNGGRYTKESLGNVFSDALNRARLPNDLTLHGLRKTAGRCLAEAGATVREIMAVLGHRAMSEAERYTRDADRAVLGDGAMSKWDRPTHLRIVET